MDWWGHYTEERVGEICQYSVDNGITFYDNGDAYVRNGRAEHAVWQMAEGVNRGYLVR